MASKDIFVPELGDFKDVAVIEVLVKAGDSVQVDAPLLTLETEKATIDVPSTDAGVIEKLHVAKGSKVSTGTLIATLQLAADAAATPTAPATATPTPTPPPAPTASSQAPKKAAASPAATPAAVAPAPVSPPTVAAPAEPAATTPGSDQEFARAHAGPSVRRFARELGVDLGRVKGTGQKGRITDADVKAFVKSLMVPAGASGAVGADSGGGAGAAGGALPKINVPDFSSFGAIETRPLGRVQRISGARLHASWVNLPHVTQFDQADVTELEQLRKSLKGRADAAGIRLTTLAFIVRACVRALQQYPLFNTSIDVSGENLVYKKYIHIGFAADTPNGLLVPVIRDADRKDIYEIARSLAELSAKARGGKLSGAEMQGGSFTISSLGGIGGTAFTPIINAPEVAILGVSRAVMTPVFRDDEFVPRLLLPLSLSYDHRVIDGANGARFTSYLAKTLADAHALTEAVP